MIYSEEELDEKLKEIERIESMTPDQAYRESVSTLGRADGITDRMDAAARIPEGRLDAVRQTSAVPRPKTSALPASAPSAPPADAGRDISYGIIRAEDPGRAEYRKRREAQRSAAMAAWRAAAAAQQRTRDELLASGRYFDDGRGNLKLRTQFREYTRRGSNGRLYGDILPDDGSGNAAIRNAGQDAYDRTIAEHAQPADGGRAEAFLRQDQRNADELKAAKQRRQSSINLIGSRILAQSLRAMNEPDDNTSGGARYTNGDRNGVEIERGYGTSRLAKRGSGRYKVGGFVSEEQLKEFNDELNAQGADFAVTGVVCQQKKDANGYESGRPHFYIQFRHKNGREFARMYSIEKAYDEARRAFKDHYQGSSDDEADDYAIKAFGDIFGRGAKREEASQWARSEATNKLLAADKKLQIEALKVLQEMDKASKTPVTAEDFYRNNPALIKMLGTDYQRDKNGQLVMTEKDGEMVPVEITLPPAEISKRAVAFFDGLRKSEANGGGAGMNEIQRAIVDGIRALTTPPAVQTTANIPQTGFYYRRETPNGPEMVATNGYVVGGKAYDRYGNLMQGVQPLDSNGNPIVGATTQAGATATQPQGGNSPSKWSWDTYRWNPEAKGGQKIDPKNIKGTGRSFDAAKERLKVPEGRKAEFEKWMDGLANLPKEIEVEGRKVPIQSFLVPKDWRTNTDYNRDYDYVAAFLANAEPGPLDHGPEEGWFWHMGDAGKMPTHPTFSAESYYAKDPRWADLAGTWDGETYIPGKAEQQSQWPTREEIQAELARRRAAKAQQQQQSAPLSQPVTSLEKPTATAQTATPRADDNAERERRAQNGARQRESTLQQAGVNENVAQHYDSIDRETMRRFREAVPEATMADIYSGKYDREIASAARLADDTSTPNVIEQAQALRAEYKSARRGEAVESAQARFDEEYRSGMDAIRKEADAKGIRGNWSKQERDSYIKREEFMLKNRLRKRLVNAQQAMS